MNAITVQHLTKSFNKFTAVDKISFSVEEGEIFGLLGPNGAGKTTIVNMLITLLEPTSGKASVAGFDIIDDKDKVRGCIGIVFQEPAIDGKLTGRENLEFHGMMYGMTNNEIKKRVKEVLKLVELTDKANVLAEKYSGGMKRRLEIARGLMHKPKVLFLDEPTIGLDTQTRRHIWDYIRKLNIEHKVTVILTTHYMEEAEYLCNRVAIIDKGRHVAMDTPARLKDLLGGDVVSLEYEGNGALLAKNLKKLSSIKKIKKTDGDQASLSLTMEHGEQRIPEIISISEKIGVKILSVNLHKPSLEDVFIHFTGKSIREQELSQGDINRERSQRRMHG